MGVLAICNGYASHSHRRNEAKYMHMMGNIGKMSLWSITNHLLFACLLSLSLRTLVKVSSRSKIFKKFLNP